MEDDGDDLEQEMDPMDLLKRLQEMSDDEDELDEDVFGGSYRGHDLEASEAGSDEEGDDGDEEGDGGAGGRESGFVAGGGSLLGQARAAADHYQEGWDTGLGAASIYGTAAEGSEGDEMEVDTAYEALADKKRKAREKKRLDKAAGDHEDTDEDEIKRSAELIDDLLGLPKRATGFSLGGGGGAGRGGKERRPRGTGRKARKRARLDPNATVNGEVTRKLGEANLLYSTGKFPDAIQLLKDVIRINPMMPDAYHTMALVYEALDDPKKAFNFSLLAAHLTPKDASVWRRLAGESHEQGNLTQAIYCLSRVVRIMPEDAEVRWDRALLLARTGDHKKACKAFEQMRRKTPDNPDVLKMLARMYHRLNQPDKAIEILEKILNDNAEKADLTVVNIMTELMLDCARWESAMTWIKWAERQYCATDGLPIDLSVKAGICLLNTGRMDEARKAFDELIEQGVEDYPDLFIKVADAYNALGKPEQAYTFYRLLRSQPDYDTPTLWANLASCKILNHEDEGATQVYEEVLRDHPTSLEAFVGQAETLYSVKMEERCAQVLGALPHQPPRDNVALWLRIAHLWYLLGYYSRFLELSMAPMVESLEAERAMAACAEITLAETEAAADEAAAEEASVPEENIFDAAKKSSRYQPSAKYLARKKQRQAEKEMRDKAAAAAAAEAAESARQRLEGGGDDDDPDAPPAAARAPQWDGRAPLLPELLRDEEQFQMLLTVLRVLLAQERYDEAQRVMQTALSIKRGMTASHRDQLKALAADIHTRKSDYVVACEIVRVACMQDPRREDMWNSFAHITACAGGLQRHHKFITKMSEAAPESLPLWMLHGHYHAMNGHGDEALHEYRRAWLARPSDPLLPLCIAATLLQHAISRKVANREKAILQSLAFLKEYEAKRNFPHEAAYNMGRACHQLGLNYLAVHYYQEALNTPTSNLPASSGDASCPLERSKQYAMVNLRCEAAHNLALIYRASNSPNLARAVLQQYATI